MKLENLLEEVSEQIAQFIADKLEDAKYRSIIDGEQLAELEKHFGIGEEEESEESEEDESEEESEEENEED